MTEFLTVEKIEQSMRAATLLDMIMTPPEDEWLRVVNAGRDGKLLWFIYNNGSGDRMWVYLQGENAVIKGFDHENELSPFAAEKRDEEQLYERWSIGMPQGLYKLFTDEELEETTFCLWTTDGGKTWQDNALPDNDGGRDWLTGFIFPDAEKLRDWADSYYDATLPAGLLAKLFERGELSAEEMLILRPECEPAGILEEYGKI